MLLLVMTLIMEIMVPHGGGGDGDGADFVDGRGD